jgi:hypothetical protein
LLIILLKTQTTKRLRAERVSNLAKKTMRFVFASSRTAISSRASPANAELTTVAASRSHVYPNTFTIYRKTYRNDARKRNHQPSSFARTQVASLGVSVDVFCCGREAASASRLAPLAERTGGVVVAEEDFGDAFARYWAAAAARPPPRGAALTIHASKGVRVARLVGAADVMSAEDAARATGAARREKNTALAATAFALRGADDSQVRFLFRSRSRSRFRFRFRSRPDRDA